MTDTRSDLASSGSKLSDERISDESLAEQVARRLSHMILQGELQPGARLPEPEIAARFGISRGPVREAFHILAREGLVQFRPRRGVVVAELTTDQVHELYEVRGALFAFACRLAATRATAEMLVSARRVLEGMTAIVRQGGGATDFMQLRNELGIIIHGAAGNAILFEEMNRLNRRALLHFAVFNREERRRESAEHWGRIVAALEARRADNAADCAFAMVEASKREVLRLLAERTQT